MKTLREVLARMAELQPIIQGHLDADELDAETQADYTARAAEWTELETQRVTLQAEADQAEAAKVELAGSLARFADVPAAVVNTATALEAPTSNAPQVMHRADPFDKDGIIRTAPDDMISRALTAVEQIGASTDDRRQGVTDTLERFGNAQMAELVLATTSPDYKSAFARMLRSGSPAGLTDGEELALRFAERSASLVRAMSSTTNGEGGFLLPTDIEPSITLTDAGTNNPIFGLARKVSTMGTTYRVVGSPNAAWSWDAENAEVSDDGVTLTNTDITLYSANAFIPVSIEATASIPQIMSDMNTVMTAGYDDHIGAALATGTGSSQPFGITVALDGTGSEVATDTTTVLVVADIYDVWDNLPLRHQRRADWIMHQGHVSRIRQFATDDGASLWVRLGDGSPNALLGRPVTEVTDMANSLAANQNIAVVGNFNDYVVAQGVGTLVDVIPHVFGSTGRPIGARGVYMKARVGADVVNNDSFRLLSGA